MATLAIVKDLDVLEDFLLGFFPGPILSMVGQLDLEGAEEALRRGIIPTVPPTAHAQNKAVFREPLAVKS
jgi:hypothetical protein